MRSHVTERFRTALSELPEHVQRRAREAYTIFIGNPYHPSLHFKKVHPMRPIYSVRIGDGYRALGIRHEDEIVWYWIGSHADYDALVAHL